MPSSFYNVGIYNLSTYNTILNSWFYDVNQIPQNLRVISVGPNNARLDWNVPVSGIPSGYEVYRAYDNTEQLTPIGFCTGLNYIDSGLEEYRTYFYRVSACYSGIADYDINYIPRDLKATSDGTNLINTLTWRLPILPATSGYGIFRSLDSFSQMSPVGNTVDLIYLDSGTKLNQSYYYRVVSLY